MPLKRHYFYLVILLLVFCCNKSLKVSFSEIHIPIKNSSIVEINIPKAEGNQTISNNINDEISNTIATALTIGDPNTEPSKSIEESINNFNSAYEKFKVDFPESDMPWEAQIDGEVIYKSPKIISLAITSYVNTGGAHGISIVSFLNFKAATGEKITNEELITDPEGFKKAVKPYFNKTIANESIAIFDTNDFQLPANIAYTEDGLVLLYNTYEIAPYSSGIIEFRVPFEEAEPFLVFNGL